MKKLLIALVLVLLSSAIGLADPEDVAFVDNRIAITCVTGTASAYAVTTKTLILGTISYQTDTTGNTLTVTDTAGKMICVPLECVVANQPMQTRDLNVKVTGIKITSPDGSYIVITTKVSRD